MENTRNFYNLEEFEKCNGLVSRAQIYKQVENGQIPSKRIGRRILIPNWFVAQLLAEPEPKPVQEKKKEKKF